MRRIGALAALGVMAIAFGTLILGGGVADEPGRPAPAEPIAYDKDSDSDYARAPAPLEQD